jgi:alpha-L-fucosidase
MKQAFSILLILAWSYQTGFSQNVLVASKPIEVQLLDRENSRATNAKDTDAAVDYTSFGGSFAAGDFIVFRNVDFGTGDLRMFMLVLAANGDNAGKKIEVRTSSPTGNKIGEITLTNTGSNRLALFLNEGGTANLGTTIISNDGNLPGRAPASHPDYEGHHRELPLFKPHYSDITPNISGVQDVYFVFPAATDVDMDFFAFSRHHFIPYANTDPVGQGLANTYEAIVEAPEARDARMQWWRDARYGMFIHFGPYAFLGGHELNPDGTRGEIMPREAEWIMRQTPPNSSVVRSNYRDNVGKNFNPYNFNAEEIVRLAQDAGQRYIVFTARHHDGFSMYNTQVRHHRDWSIITAANANHDGFTRDLLRELADACHATMGTDRPIKFAAYLTMPDWFDLTQYPRYGNATSSQSEFLGVDRLSWSFNGTTTEERLSNKADYLARLKGQLRELIVDYGAHLIWWDDANMQKLTRDEAYALYHYMFFLNPNIITNNRIFTDRVGGRRTARSLDFYTAENTMATITSKLTDDVEACMTLNGKWGFHYTDVNWKPPSDVVNMLMRMVGYGGNLLLNIGPDGRGDVPQASQDILREVGRWLEVNGDAIFGTRPAFYETSEKTGPAHSVYTTAKEGKLFIHLMPAFTENTLELPAMRNPILGIRTLNNNSSVDYQITDSKMIFDLTRIERDPYNTIIEIRVDGGIPQRR